MILLNKLKEAECQTSISIMCKISESYSDRIITQEFYIIGRLLFENERCNDDLMVLEEKVHVPIIYAYT